MVITAPTLLGFNQGSSSTLTITTSTDIVAGRLVVVAIAPYARSITSITDPNNGSYTKAVGFVSGTDRLEYWYKANAQALASGSTITCNLGSGGGGIGSVIACQVAGILPVSPYDSPVSKSLDDTSGGDSTPNLNSGTPTTNSTIIFGAIGYGISTGTINLTDHAPFSTVKIETQPGITSDDTNLALAYTISTSKTVVTYAPTFNTTPDYDFALIAGFKGSPSKSFGTVIA